MKSCSFTARWNEALLDENYQKWQRSPRSVSPDWAAFFEGFELGTTRVEKNGAPAALSDVDEQRVLQTKVDLVIHTYRTLGHSVAKLDPLLSEPLPQQDRADFALESFGLRASDLEKEVSSHLFRASKKFQLRELILVLERIYCASIGTEFMHIQDARQRNWISARLELEQEKEETAVTSYLYSSILRTLYRAEAFEHFLHTNYVGHKRFSLEGAESLLVSLQALMGACEGYNIQQAVLGMTHRGRLNILANLLHKPLETIFDEFSHNVLPQTVENSGDVKYHLGYRTTWKSQAGHEVQIHLVANPSHLEAVGPVVQGKTRALQHALGNSQDKKRVLAVLIHGDAAFAAQGVVAEMFNLSQLPGYQVEGTIHVIVNNQIGFTTLPSDARSSRCCTDVAKMVEAPVFHVNGDDPLAVHAITKTALEFRQNFGKDVVVDIVCFRRHGHNEADEPTFTQPGLYKRIKSHPLLSDILLKKAEELGIVEGRKATTWKVKETERLEAAFAQSKTRADHSHSEKSGIDGSAAMTIAQSSYSHKPVQTAIGSDMLDKIMQVLTVVPGDFHVLPKVRRMLLERRQQIWQAKGPYDWGIAEALAFGSLLLEKVPVRLSGQDSQRGTFSHRHSVLHDEVTCERYIPLNHLSPYQARFCVYNSPLSEYAVLGFDYGFSLESPSMLCLWEAQFGDFANGAQIVIDQFISSSEAKWRRQSSIVMLLPHGYEGQGPEHSSSRLERFLQLCAEENMQICNPSTPAQYFHALRRQVHGRYCKPLIITTPKSLLRHEQSVSKARDFTSSHFFEILSDPPDTRQPEKVRRIVFCSGKVYYDLLQYRAAHQLEKSVVLVRVEQLYPLHEEELIRVFQRYPSATRVVWCQEESSNMGAWAFIRPQLQRLLGCEIFYAGRPASASPATGFNFVHKQQQVALVKAAFGGQDP
ncbi:MAG: 2-oxoglutarate dehydrogenase E1 component [Candidatus Xiphinematobacter sp.]|nr:MAG: 2-oxoglutarate dehydrogenase E1 component [Candidatus Xiphinematobacter sp.]